MSTPTITPEVGKRYVTRGGWITPPIETSNGIHYCFAAGGILFDNEGYFNNEYELHPLDLISEYVEPTVTDTFRRDLVARLYVAMIGDVQFYQGDTKWLSNFAISAADTLIEAMEEQP